MEIVRYWNPLENRVILSDFESALFKKAVAESHWRYLLGELRDEIKPYRSVVEVRDHIKSLTSAEGMSNQLEQIDSWSETLLDALINGSHDGDCICVAMTCHKCVAEELIQIDTIPGLLKYWGNRIPKACEENRTPGEILHWLRASGMPGQVEAANWLESYYREYFPHDL